jgi:predicted lipid carrier protein YhbT
MTTFFSRKLQFSGDLEWKFSMGMENFNGNEK